MSYQIKLLKQRGSRRRPATPVRKIIAKTDAAKLAIAALICLAMLINALIYFTRSAPERWAYYHYVFSEWQREIGVSR